MTQMDHVMTYFFVDAAALEDFDALNAAMADAGRTPYLTAANGSAMPSSPCRSLIVDCSA